MYYSECGGLFMRRHRKSLWEKALHSIILSAAAGSAVTLTCSAAFSAFTLFFMDDMDSLGFFSSFALAAGALSAGYTCGRHRRRKGIAEGLLCGMLIYAVIAVSGLVLSAELPGIKKLLLTAFFSAAGGVYGVNSKRPKGLTDC